MGVRQVWSRRAAAVAIAGTLLAGSALVAPSADAAVARRAVSLKTSAGAVTVGGKVTFSGKVTNTPKGSVVAVQRRSGTKWVTVVKTRTTNAAGAYRVAAVDSAANRVAFRAVAVKQGARVAVASASRYVDGYRKAKVTVSSVSATLPMGKNTTTLSGKMSPFKSGAKATLQRYNGKAWVAVATTAVTKTGTFARVTNSVASGTSAKFRFLIPQVKYLRQAVSPTITVTVKGPSVPASERTALLDLYQGTGGPRWSTATGWNTGTDVCVWYGVTCAGGHVTDLSLSYNALTGAVPASFGALTSLTGLNLTGNQLTAVPASIGSLTKLKSLLLDSNRITALPDAFAGLTNLTGLYLAGNRLTALPASIGGLTNLKTLWAGGNQLASAPASLPAGLTSLDLGGNQLAQLPDAIGGLVSLVSLDLSGNQLSALPPSIAWTALTSLNLSGNQLVDVPDAIAGLDRLTTLNLGGNLLTADSSGFAALAGLPALTTLDLSGNQFAALPDAIGSLTQLVNLAVGGNQLTDLPTWISGMSSLRVLALGGNKLAAVPDSLQGMTALNTLMLGANQLTDLPAWFPGLTGLHTLDLSGNRLQGDISGWAAPLAAGGQIWTLLLNGNGCLNVNASPSLASWLYRMDPSWNKGVCLS